jgi:hypothetical protein
MTLLEFLENWFVSLEQFLAGRGIAGHLSRSPDDGRPKAFRGVSLKRGSVEGELLLWDTGEAELNLMPLGDVPSQEHLEIEATAALAEALARLLAVVAPTETESGHT